MWDGGGPKMSSISNLLDKTDSVSVELSDIKEGVCEVSITLESLNTWASLS